MAETERMTPPSDAQLSDLLVRVGERQWRGADRSEVAGLLAALRDARAENERQSDLIDEFRKRDESQDRIRERLTAERDTARRTLAELRARIEALCDEAERNRADWQDTFTLQPAEVRAALSPAEETK